MEYVVSNAGTREILDWAQNIKQPFWIFRGYDKFHKVCNVFRGKV